MNEDVKNLVEILVDLSDDKFIRAIDSLCNLTGLALPLYVNGDNKRIRAEVAVSFLKHLLDDELKYKIASYDNAGKIINGDNTETDLQLKAWVELKDLQ